VWVSSLDGRQYRQAAGRLPPECDELRHEVRAFLADEVARGTFDPHRPGHGGSHSKEFSQRIGAKGWIGMT